MAREVNEDNLVFTLGLLSEELGIFGGTIKDINIGIMSPTLTFEVSDTRYSPASKIIEQYIELFICYEINSDNVTSI